MSIRTSGGDDDVVSEIMDRNTFYDADDDGSVITASTLNADAEEKGDFENKGEIKASYESLTVQIKDLKGRLSRRNKILEDVRVAYLRDVVAIKHWIKNVLTNSERAELFRQVDEFMPSIDLNGPLILHGPKDAEFRLKPCSECGGRVDIVLNDNKIVTDMKKKLAAQKELEENIRLQVATTEALFEKLAKESSDERKSHEEEKRFMFTEMKRIKEIAEKVNIENSKIKDENIAVKEREASVKKENAKLKEEILRISIYEQKYYDCEKDVTSLKTQLRHSETAGESLKVEIEKQSKEIEVLKPIIPKLESDIKTLATEIADQKAKLYRNKEMIEALEKSLQSKEADILSFQTQLSSSSEELNDLKYQSAADLQKLEAQCDQVRDELINTESNLRAQKKATFAAEQEITIKIKEIEKRDKLLLEREDEITDLAADCESFEEEIEALKMFLQQSFGGDVEIPDFAAMIAEANDNDDDNEDDEAGSQLSEDSAYQDDVASIGERSTASNQLNTNTNTADTIDSSTDIKERKPSTSSGDGSRTPPKSSNDSLNNTASKSDSPLDSNSDAAAETENPTRNNNSNNAETRGSDVDDGNINSSSNNNDKNNKSSPPDKKNSPPGNKNSSKGSSDAVSKTRSDSVASTDNNSDSGSTGRAKKREVVEKKSRGRRATSSNEDAAKVRDLVRNSGRAAPPSAGGEGSNLDGVDDSNANTNTNAKTTANNASDDQDNILGAIHENVPADTRHERHEKHEGHEKHEKHEGREKKERHSSRDKEKREPKSVKSERSRSNDPSSTVTSESITAGNATSSSDVSASFIPPPRQRAEVHHHAAKDEKKPQMKSKIKLAQMVMPVEMNVELEPPPADASPEELKFREILLPLLGVTLGPNASKKAMNCMSLLIHENFLIQMTNFKTLWDSLLLLKRSLDFFTKIKIILDRFLSVSEKKNDISGMEIAAIISEIVPIAGNMLGTKLTPIWRDESKIDEVLVQFLIPNVDPNTGEFIYLKYTDFLKVNQNELKRSVDGLESEVNKIFEYSDEQLFNINEKIISHIRDWTFSKTEMSQIQTRLDKQNDTLTKDFNLIIANLNREIGTITAKFDLAKASAKQLEVKCEDLTIAVSRLEKYQPMYEKLERETKTFREDKEALKRIIKESREETANVEAKLFAKNAEYESKCVSLKNTEDALNIEAVKCVDWEHKYHNMEGLKVSLEKEIASMIFKEEERLRNMKSMSTQVELIMCNSDTQTDFLTTNMTLKPLVGAIKGPKSEKNVYPAVRGEDPTEEHTRRKVLENPDMQHLVLLNNLEYNNQKRPFSFDDEVDFNDDVYKESFAAQGVISNEKNLDDIILNSPDKDTTYGNTSSVDYSHYDSKIKDKEKLIYKSLIKAQKRLLFSKSRGEASDLLDSVAIHKSLLANTGKHDKRFLSYNTLSELNKFEFFDKDLNPKFGSKRIDTNAITNAKLTTSISLELPSIMKLGHQSRVAITSGENSFSKDDSDNFSVHSSDNFRNQGLDSVSLNDSIDTGIYSSPGSLGTSRSLSSLLKLDIDGSNDVKNEIARIELSKLVTKDSHGRSRAQALTYNHVSNNKIQISNASSLPGSKVDFVVGGASSQQLYNRRKVANQERSIPYFQEQFTSNKAETILNEIESMSSLNASVRTKSSKGSLIADLKTNFFG